MISSKEIGELKKVKWFNVSSRGKNHALLMMDAVLGISRDKDYPKLMSGLSFKSKYYIQTGGKRALGQKDFEKLFKLLEKKGKNEPDFYYKLGENIVKVGKEIRNETDRLKDAKWNKLDNKKLSEIILDFCDLYAKMYCLPLVYSYYIYLNDVVAERIAEKIRGKIGDEADKIIPVLFEPEKISEISEEKKELVKIALKGLEKGRTDDKKIENHWKKYAYLNNYYFWGKGYTLLEMKERLNDEISKGKDEIENEMSELRVHEADYSLLDEHDRKIVKSMKKMAYALQFADESMIYQIHNLRGLYNECAKRLGISYNELVSMRFEELKESLEKKKSVIDKKILDERFEDHALIFYGDKSFVLSGKELEEFNEKDENINEDIKEFKGNIGFKSGIIKGKVRILTYTEQISSFKEGEILVTPMTNPSFVPAMRKAAAIITDDGGLLCHAAIVSREMKKPCIIGTKIATQVLKDGDLVEVDAEKGIVKILERKK